MANLDDRLKVLEEKFGVVSDSYDREKNLFWACVGEKELTQEQSAEVGQIMRRYGGYEKAKYAFMTKEQREEYDKFKKEIFGD